jgi:hypothetical protein
MPSITKNASGGMPNKLTEVRNRYSCNIQGVSRLVDITAGGDFLGLCDEKSYINMCPILDGYGVMTA